MYSSGSHNLLGEANDTAGRSGTSVTGLQGLVVAALTQVIGTRVHNNRSANDRVGTKQLNQEVLLLAAGNTLTVSGDVTQVTNVSDVILWSTVGLREWVEVRTSRSAAVGVVTKGVDVETSKSVWAVTRDLPGDRGGLVLGGLLKVNNTRDVLVSSQNSDFGLVTMLTRRVRKFAQEFAQ